MENESDRRRRAEREWKRGGVSRFLNGDSDPWRPYPGTADESKGATTPSEPTDDFYKTLQQAHPDHWVFQDDITSKRLRDLLRDAQAAETTTPAENAALRQTRAKGQKFPRSDKVPPKGLAGQAGGQTDSDMEYLQDQEGVSKWNASRKF